MLISTRGRYALRVMIDLAEQGQGELISMKTVSERQNISLKYLERILPALVSAGMIEGVPGKSGGYRLTGLPDQYRVGDILRVTETDLAPVSCLAENAVPCEHKSECRTLPLWCELNRRVNEYLDSVRLSDLMRTQTQEA